MKTRPGREERGGIDAMTVPGAELSSYFSSTIVSCFPERELLCRGALLTGSAHASADARVTWHRSPATSLVARLYVRLNRYVGGSFDLRCAK